MALKSDESARGRRASRHLIEERTKGLRGREFLASHAGRVADLRSLVAWPHGREGRRDVVDATEDKFHHVAQSVALVCDQDSVDYGRQQPKEIDSGDGAFERARDETVELTEPRNDHAKPYIVRAPVLLGGKPMVHLVGCRHQRREKRRRDLSLPKAGMPKNVVEDECKRRDSVGGCWRDGGGFEQRKELGE